jgi:hypothetical protein
VIAKSGPRDGEHRKREGEPEKRDAPDPEDQRDFALGAEGDPEGF